MQVHPFQTPKTIILQKKKKKHKKNPRITKSQSQSFLSTAQILKSILIQITKNQEYLFISSLILRSPSPRHFAFSVYFASPRISPHPYPQKAGKSLFNMIHDQEKRFANKLETEQLFDNITYFVLKLNGF